MVYFTLYHFKQISKVRGCTIWNAVCLIGAPCGTHESGVLGLMLTIGFYVHSTWEDCLTLASLKLVKSVGMKASLKNLNIFILLSFNLSVPNSVKKLYPKGFSFLPFPCWNLIMSWQNLKNRQVEWKYFNILFLIFLLRSRMFPKCHRYICILIIPNRSKQIPRLISSIYITAKQIDLYRWSLLFVLLVHSNIFILII